MQEKKGRMLWSFSFLLLQTQKTMTLLRCVMKNPNPPEHSHRVFQCHAEMIYYHKVGLTALSLGLIFAGTCNDDVGSVLVQVYPRILAS